MNLVVATEIQFLNLEPRRRVIDLYDADRGTYHEFLVSFQEGDGVLGIARTTDMRVSFEVVQGGNIITVNPVVYRYLF